MRKIFVFFLYVVGILHINAQSKIERALQILEKNHNQEKVYLQLDKDQYVAGDNIFFKSFVFNGYNRSNISATLFVELYNQQKKIIDKKTIAILNGEGQGSFTLKDNLTEDLYYIRAYTPWMANFPEEWNYLKAIPIYNPDSPKRLVKDSKINWTAIAVPEGGNLISDIASKVAVRLSSLGSLPTDWNGYVYDESKPSEKIATFKNMDANVAVFSFTPKAGSNYKVSVEDSKGNKQTVSLPKVLETGAVININYEKDGIRYTIKGSQLAEGLKGYNIVGTMNNKMAYKAKISTTNHEASSVIPIKASDEVNGVINLVLFDPNENPVSQRLFFINPKHLSYEKPSFGQIEINNTPRAFNSLDIQADQEFRNFTVLVRDVSNRPADYNSENILSYLWLSSDFQTPIFSPANYFSANANTEALDALLISEKWERFDWNQLLMGIKPEIRIKPVQSLSYKGFVTANGSPVNNKMVNLVFVSPEGQNMILQAQTDNGGYIYLDDLNFENEMRVVASVNDPSGSIPETVKINVIFQPIVNNIPYKGKFSYRDYLLTDNIPENKVDPQIEAAINNHKNYKKIYNDETQIEAVEVKGKKKSPKEELDKSLSTGMFSGGDTIIDLVNENQDAENSISIFHWLQGKIAGVTFQTDNTGNLVPYIRGTAAKLYLDEMPSSVSMIGNMAPSNIAMVKVFKTGGLINNAIALYTKKGSTQRAENKETYKNLVNSPVIKGFDTSTEFLQPDVTSELYKAISKDTRELLYWEPKLTEDMGMAPRIKFFNNDNAKNREIIIISFDADDRILFYNEIK